MLGERARVSGDEARVLLLARLHVRSKSDLRRTRVVFEYIYEDTNVPPPHPHPFIHEPPSLDRFFAMFESSRTTYASPNHVSCTPARRPQDLDVELELQAAAAAQRSDLGSSSEGGGGGSRNGLAEYDEEEEEEDDGAAAEAAAAAQVRNMDGEAGNITFCSVASSRVLWVLDGWKGDRDV